MVGAKERLVRYYLRNDSVPAVFYAAITERVQQITEECLQARMEAEDAWKPPLNYAGCVPISDGVRRAEADLLVSLQGRCEQLRRTDRAKRMEMEEIPIAELDTRGALTEITMMADAGETGLAHITESAARALDGLNEMIEPATGRVHPTTGPALLTHTGPG